jgi:predicted PurR-regulated permease PerM
MSDQQAAKTGRHVTFWLIIFFVVFGFFYLVRSILLPFAMAMAVAYFFDPLVRRLQRNGLPRWLSGMIVLLVFVIAFAGAAFVIVPVLVEQVEQLISAVPGWIASAKTQLLPQVNTMATRLGLGDLQHLNDSAAGYLGKGLSTAGAVAGGVVTGSLAVLDLLSLLLVMPVVAFYMLRDWDHVVSDLDRCLPLQHKATLKRLLGEIDRTLSGFIRGQALVCLIQATYYAVALSVLGLDFSVLVGVATGILTFIPYLGAIIGLVTGVIIAIAEWHDPLHVVFVVIAFAIGQILEANVITPKLVGDRIGLHPAWVIFAVLAGGALFGFAGILLAVPVAAVIGVLIRFAVEQYLNSRFYKGDAALS